MTTTITWRKKIALGLVPAIAATGLALVNASTASAATGPLTVTPETGDQASTANVAFSAPCPAAAENFMVRVSGAGFSAGSNAVAFNPIPGGSGAISNYPMGNSWTTVSTSQGGAATLSGPATVTLLCLDAAGENILEDYESTVTFGPGTAYAVAVAATPTPTPPPPTPTPDPTPPPTPTPVPPPTQNNQNITVAVPDNGQNGTGQFTMTVPSNATINMGAGTLTGPVGSQYLTYAASLNDVSVTDSRPGFPAWAVAGQMSSFTGMDASNNGFLLPAPSLGWDPSVFEPGAGATEGDTVTPGYPSGGPGLSVPAILAGAPDGHAGPDQTAVLDAGLTLNIPTSARAGAYGGTLTLTSLA